MDAEIRQFFTESYERNWYLAARARVLTAIIRPLCAAGSRLVDVGAGTGSILGRLGDTASSIGIEGEWQLARVGQSLHKVRFAVGNVSSGIPLSSGSADVALSLDVLEHLEDDRAALAEIYRILKPGGTLIATVPAFQSLWSQHDELHHHKRRYSRASLLAVLVGCGFTCTRLTYFNTLLFPLVYASRMLERLRRSPAQHTDYDKAPRLLGSVLGGVFGFEEKIVPRWNLPVGVSLLAIATTPLEQ